MIGVKVIFKMYILGKIKYFIWKNIYIYIKFYILLLKKEDFLMNFKFLFYFNFNIVMFNLDSFSEYK